MTTILKTSSPVKKSVAVCVLLVSSLSILSACSSSESDISDTNTQNSAQGDGTEDNQTPDTGDQSDNVGNNNTDTTNNSDDSDTDTTDNPDNSDQNTDADNSDNNDSSYSTTNAEPIVLSPLPQPPLSSAPAANDEPIAVTGPVSTVTEYFLVRDPGERFPDDTSGELTEADYNAGALAPVVINPTNVDTSVNNPPIFEALENQTVFAGELLEILLKPVDTSGKLPGQFAESLPTGMQNVDNLNGTKTLRWRPLQPDVGIHSINVVAVDPEVPEYRTLHTIRVRVLLPEDQSNIVNLAPAVNAVALHTVQVNDPVVVEIRGTDPNGTIPSLALFNQPPGATFTAHYSEPDVSVLRFIPRNTGLITMTVLARDAVDPDSTGQTTINIDVRPESDFLRDGPSLAELATARGFRFGYASKRDFYYRPDGALYARIAAEEFNAVTPENSFKWGFINPLPGRYRWAAADNLVSFARAKGLEVHGHTLVWHRQLPNWIKFSALSEREAHMREFIDRMLTRYADRVPVWDVVNEVFEDDGSYRNSTWYEAMGQDYVEIAFRQARESAPNARLLYNDYDVSWNGPKSDAMFTMLEGLKDRETPLDGVGFQMHVFADFDRFDEVEANFQKAANLDLNIYITELDVSMNADHTDKQQADVYRRILDICLKQPRCKGLTAWGFTDMYSWRRHLTPLFLDTAYQVKPAYTAMQQRLSEN